LKSSRQDAQKRSVSAVSACPAGLPRHAVKPVLASKSNQGQRWWGGVAVWGMHGNEEFTKWWNHWTSRIPHSGATLNSHQTRKNDV